MQCSRFISSVMATVVLVVGIVRPSLPNSPCSYSAAPVPSHRTNLLMYISETQKIGSPIYFTKKCYSALLNQAECDEYFNIWIHPFPYKSSFLSFVDCDVTVAALTRLLVFPGCKLQIHNTTQAFLSISQTTILRSSPTVFLCHVILFRIPFSKSIRSQNQILISFQNWRCRSPLAIMCHIWTLFCPICAEISFGSAERPHTALGISGGDIPGGERKEAGDVERG